MTFLDLNALFVFLIKVYSDKHISEKTEGSQSYSPFIKYARHPIRASSNSKYLTYVQAHIITLIPN